MTAPFAIAPDPFDPHDRVWILTPDGQAWDVSPAAAVRLADALLRAAHAPRPGWAPLPPCTICGRPTEPTQAWCDTCRTPVTAAVTS